MCGEEHRGGRSGATSWVRRVERHVPQINLEFQIHFHCKFQVDLSGPLKSTLESTEIHLEFAVKFAVEQQRDIIPKSTWNYNSTLDLRIQIHSNPLGICSSEWSRCCPDKEMRKKIRKTPDWGRSKIVK